jgi:hypothetical protein
MDNYNDYWSGFTVQKVIDDTDRFDIINNEYENRNKNRL